MVGEDEFHDRPSGVDYAGGVGAHHHPLRAGRLAGGSEVLATFHLDHADAARARFVLVAQFVEVHVAQRGYLDARRGGRLHEVRALGDLYLFVVYGQLYRFHVEFSLEIYLTPIAPNLHLSMQVPHLMQAAWSIE